MLKQVQHDVTVRFWSFCHPEPGPELDSGSIDFGISLLAFRFLQFKSENLSLTFFPLTPSLSPLGKGEG
jgi:hypothetical protein